jgi:hypothetical protein
MGSLPTPKRDAAVDITIANTNITQVVADLLVLKHADGLHGADRVVADAVGFDARVGNGEAEFWSGKGTAAPEVLFIGVGPLSEFRYEQIQEFASKAIKLARMHKRPIYHVGLTTHGSGYGLDSEQAFLSLVAGIVSEWRCSACALNRITIAEISDKKCALFERMLQGALERFGLEKGTGKDSAFVPRGMPSGTGDGTNIVDFGARVEEMPRLFVAMPFADDFLDEYQIGFCEAAKANSYVCERLDVQVFTGDVVAEIKRRIAASHGVIALVNDHNPNVFLEVGFALAHNKPTLLVARQGTKLPFDVSGHRCIWYKSIVELRNILTREIAALKAQGVFAKSG